MRHILQLEIHVLLLRLIRKCSLLRSTVLNGLFSQCIQPSGFFFNYCRHTRARFLKSIYACRLWANKHTIHLAKRSFQYNLLDDFKQLEDIMILLQYVLSWKLIFFANLPKKEKEKLK